MAIQMVQAKKEDSSFKDRKCSDMTIVPIAIPIIFWSSYFTNYHNCKGSE